ncbi:MAG: sterol desaturase family protein [Alphaproteobacteria bacterium]|nr:sterol desaturase family protein [Alphaproteobacteria bacterium]
MELWIDLFEDAQTGLFEAVMKPLTLALGQHALLEQAYEATGWFLIGLLQIAFMLMVLLPLERHRPAEPVTDRRAIYTDVIYTLIHRLGLFRLVFFFTLEPPVLALTSWYFLQGGSTWQLDALWPGVTDLPWVSFLLYLVVLDALNYFIHRAQHQFNPWWALHALHHSQRQMTLWTDNRNHLLDDIIVALLFALASQLLGVPPGQFVWLLAVSQLAESLQHANLRSRFGGLRYGLVSPQFHRYHHAIGVGHESPKRVPGGHNFGVLLPWWDMMLDTARFDDVYLPTGIRDQAEQGRDYGQGFWRQQWLGLRRLWGG